jgi:head-tail adaptor
MSYIPVTIQHMDPDTEEWTDLLHLHATKVNQSGGSEAFSAGREQFRPKLSFDFRWSKVLETLRYDTQNHRIVYQGHTFNIVDYDDYMEQHLQVRLVGEAYG